MTEKIGVFHVLDDSDSFVLVRDGETPPPGLEGTETVPAVRAPDGSLNPSKKPPAKKAVASRKRPVSANKAAGAAPENKEE